MTNNESEFSKEELAAIQGNIEQIASDKNMLLINRALVEIIKRYKKNPFQEVEKILRNSNSNIFLVAIPIEETKGEMEAFLPDMITNLPYYLWICVNGEEEASKLRNDLGITYEENFEFLEKCGFLTPKEGSDTSRKLNARLN